METSGEDLVFTNRCTPNAILNKPLISTHEILTRGHINVTPLMCIQAAGRTNDIPRENRQGSTDNNTIPDQN
jgi:hypothetical protein